MFKKAAIFLIKAYQLILSSEQGILRRRAPTCRFYPTCSEYTKQAVDKYGVLGGLFKGVKRISHCHPFNAGGFDPPTLNYMNIIILLFNEVLYRPLFNGLIFLYNIIPLHDFGVAIILLTIIIRLVLYPLNQKAITSQKAMGELQPQIKAIQAKYPTDKVKQSQGLMELYKKNNINPASGCLPILIQLPILIALYQVFWNGLNPDSLTALYSFVAHPTQVNPMFLGLISLAKSNYVLAILAGIFTFWQSKMMVQVQPNAGQGTDFSAAMNKQMVYFMPLFTVFIAWKLPAGLSLYWVVTTLAGIVQQYLVIRKHGKTTN